MWPERPNLGFADKSRQLPMITIAFRLRRGSLWAPGGLEVVQLPQEPPEDWTGPPQLWAAMVQVVQEVLASEQLQKVERTLLRQQRFRLMRFIVDFMASWLSLVICYRLIFSDIYVPMPWGRTCLTCYAASASFCFGISLVWVFLLACPDSPNPRAEEELVAVSKELLESRLSTLREANPNLDFELQTPELLGSNGGMLSVVTTSGTP